ncbi:MAG: FAD:protein FMN transferase [Phycisphaerae bacterium]
MAGRAPALTTDVVYFASKATDADALATAVSVMGVEKGLALIKKLPKTEVILIPASARMTGQSRYELIKTSGAEKLIR